jgi:hypothetical protein
MELVLIIVVLVDRADDIGFGLGEVLGSRAY